jgi:CubicO group peptidase (beta-lactamase class C family)
MHLRLFTATSRVSGLLVRRINGKSLDTFFADEIAAPLGLTLDQAT